MLLSDKRPVLFSWFLGLPELQLRAIFVLIMLRSIRISSEIAGPGQDSGRRLRPCHIFRTISTLRVVSHEKLRLWAAPATENPAPKPANPYSKAGVPAVCQTKTDFEDENHEIRDCDGGLRLPFQDLRP